MSFVSLPIFMTVLLYSLESSTLSVRMSFYVVHFNLQINSTSPTNLFNKYITVLLQ